MKDTVEFLRSLDYLRKLPHGLISDIAKDMEPVVIHAGSVLFREGDEGDAVYIVVTGHLSIEHEGARLVTRGPGELVGEFALIDHHTRSATVVAATDARLLKWPRPPLPGRCPGI